MIKKSWMSILVCIQLSGCVGWQAGLIKQAAFDHRCTEDQVQVVRDSGVEASRTADVNVCGKVRRYRDLGGSRIFAWIDITDGVPSSAPPQKSPEPSK